jgi:hypothetical protein
MVSGRSALVSYHPRFFLNFTLLGKADRVAFGLCFIVALQLVKVMKANRIASRIAGYVFNISAACRGVTFIFIYANAHNFIRSLISATRLKISSPACSITYASGSAAAPNCATFFSVASWFTLLPSRFNAAIIFAENSRSSRLTGWRFRLPVLARNLETEQPTSAAFLSVFSFSSGENLTVIAIRFVRINSTLSTSWFLPFLLFRFSEKQGLNAPLFLLQKKWWRSKYLAFFP